MNNNNESSPTFPIFLIAIGTVCGLAATDLILPAIPMLPSVLDGTANAAQWVLASFALGTGLGLLAFGELGARFKVIDILVASLLAFAILSIAATWTTTLLELSLIRFLQGVFASAPAVYAPVMVNRLYDERAAVHMIGRIGSIESMAPAIAPIIGAALLSYYGWKSSFYLVAGTAILLALSWVAGAGWRSAFSRLERAEEGYLALLSNTAFMRYALSQACTVGALLVIVFAAPKVIISSLGGELQDFIIMQVLGITFFVISANMSGAFTRWWGDENTIYTGSAVTAAGCAGILLMAILDLGSVGLLWPLFIVVNLGLGIRGPVGFYKSLAASRGNQSRGSALVIFFVMIVTAAGTVIVAPFIENGLLPLAIVAFVISNVAVLALALLGPSAE